MEDYIEQLKPLFAQVAEKIGQGAEFGWYVVMKQQYVKGMGYFLVGVPMIILSVYGIYGLIKWYKKTDDNEEESLAVFGIFILSGIVILAGYNGLYQGLAHFINPEYYALEFFINLVK